MRIAITGSNGFLGSLVYNKLITSNEVFKLNRSGSYNFSPIPSNIDVLIHCASYLPKVYDDFSESLKCLTDNGIATLNILQSAEDANVKSFIYISSGQIYKWKDFAFETDLIDPTERATPYLASKMVADCYIRSFKSKMRKVILRPSLIYGIGMKKSGILFKLINKINSNELIDFDNYYIDLVNVNDVSNFIAKSCYDDISGVYNIGGGNGLLSIYDLANYIANILGKNLNIKKSKIIKGHAILNIDKAKKIGYTTTELKAGLKEYLDHFND